MKFLFKFPSRGRPELFMKTLKKHVEFLSGNHEYKFIFSFDEDDNKMKDPNLIDSLNSMGINYQLFYGYNKNKIEAINNNLIDEDFDILMLIADDMIPTLKNYDEIIYEIFEKSEHKLDATIHFNTPRWADILDVWCIMGKNYYDRFKYIYHPEYKSIFCDNEYTEVSTILNRRIFSEICLFEHRNHEQIGDETEVRNWQFNNEDTLTYNKRKENNFYITNI